MSLIENGVNPDALAVSSCSSIMCYAFTLFREVLEADAVYQAVIKDLRKEAGASRGFATEQQQGLPE